MHKTIRRTGLGALLLMTAGCAKMCAAEDVAMGVARLTTLNADALTNALDADDFCGFSAMDVKLAAKTEGEVGKIGTLTLTVKDCELDFGPNGMETSRNCQDKVTKGFGKATVSGTKTVTGWLTGNMANPIIPAGPDAVVVSLDATFDNFHAAKDGGTATMTWVTGGITGNLRPRLAVGASGACSVRTSNTSFDSVTYKPTKAVLQSGDTKIEVDIDGSLLDGQYGLGPSGENLIQGKMSVWGEEHTVPPEGDEDGLDPEYDAAKFIEGYACAEGLAEPLSYTCDRLPELAQTSARGLVKLVGTTTSILNGHPGCGFEADAVKAGATITGDAPGAGSLALSVNACAINFASKTELPANCKGEKTEVSGKVTATSKKTVEGFLTGQQDPPIVPQERTSTVFEHTALVYDDFTLSVGGGATLSFTGTVSAVVHPVAGEVEGATAPPADGPLYAIATPVLGIEDLKVATGTVTLKSGGMTFAVDVEALELDAFNGSFDGASNEIAGTLKANTVAFDSLPSATLDPAFSQAAFDATYVCTPGLKEPVPAE